ncbi:Uncharacterised protein [Serratia rubidaea]|uniref:Uncharacterized protein n=1 Tax=Serratia rubidaea TaxID=61652 RepID=A0A3S4G9L2_SERRU|nr:Uncharacterised protein [Serratia rubidaea]
MRELSNVEVEAVSGGIFGGIIGNIINAGVDTLTGIAGNIVGNIANSIGTTIGLGMGFLDKLVNAFRPNRPTQLRRTRQAQPLAANYSQPDADGAQPP